MAGKASKAKEAADKYMGQCPIEKSKDKAAEEKQAFKDKKSYELERLKREKKKR